MESCFCMCKGFRWGSPTYPLTSAVLLHGVED